MIQQEMTFRLVMLGSTSVGKSNLMSMYAHNKLPDIQTYTIGVDFAIKKGMIREI